MKIERVQLTVVEMQQNWPVAPYTHRSGESSKTRRLICKLTTDDGAAGWGEASGIPPAEVAALQEKLQAQMRERSPFDVEGFYATVQCGSLSNQSAVEMALWDLMGKACGQPVYNLLGGLCRRHVPLAACMGISKFEEAGKKALKYKEMGFKTVKTKAGRDAAQDLETVRGFRDAVGMDLDLRIDANQGYSPEVALKLCQDLELYNLQYFEQPCPREALAGIAELRKQTSIPIALNESCGPLEEIPEIIRLDACDVLMPDTPQCGGILKVKKIAAITEAAGIPCVMHCGHDLGVKTAMMLHVAAATPNFTMGNDSTYYSMQDDILAEPFEIVDGGIFVRDLPGLGADVEEGKLRKYEVRE